MHKHMCACVTLGLFVCVCLLDSYRYTLHGFCIISNLLFLSKVKLSNFVDKL